MSNFFSGTGAVIATYVGTGISIISAIGAWIAKSQTKKYRDEVIVRFQSNKLSVLIEKGNKAKDAVFPYTSKKSKTAKGLNESKDKELVQDFFTEVNENVHLINVKKIKTLINNGKKLLSENNYDDLLYCISDLISELKKVSDTNLVRE